MHGGMRVRQPGRHRQLRLRLLRVPRATRTVHAQRPPSARGAQCMGSRRCIPRAAGAYGKGNRGYAEQSCAEAYPCGPEQPAPPAPANHSSSSAPDHGGKPALDPSGPHEPEPEEEPVTHEPWRWQHPRGHPPDEEVDDDDCSGGVRLLHHTLCVQSHTRRPDRSAPPRASAHH